MDGNIKNLQDAMEWLDCNIREEAELDGEMSNKHAIQLGFIRYMLTKFPRRNCDVGTQEEQAKRYIDFCDNYPKCTGCPCVGQIKYNQCELAWAQLPYDGEKSK